MTTLRSLYHLARADFLERVRRYSFLVLAGVTIYMGYLFVPPAGANYQTVALGDARGIYNSPWIGTMFGIMISTLMTLVAFYPIKNAVTRDRQTHVGQIIAATPMRKSVYMLGKWLSNIAVLALLMMIMTLMALVMQWIRAEDLSIDIWALVPPIWLIGFPALSVIAALAVLFEAIPFLQGGFGNIVYFFLYMTLLIFFIEGTTGADGLLYPSNDFFGISHPLADMQRIVALYDPDYQGALIIGGAELSDSPLLFPWHGISWSLDLVAQRFLWVGVATLLAIGAAIPFDRFDPSRQRMRKKRKRKKDRRDDTLDATLNVSGETPATRTIVTLTTLPDQKSHGRFGTVLSAELRLMLRGQPWWWYAVAVGLIIASAVTPADINGILLAIAWLWPILVWSPMGARERLHFTHDMVFSVAHPVRRQLAATWLAGVAVALLVTGGGLARSILTGETTRVLVIMAGVGFVPSLALAFGVWSHSPRLFEVIYLTLWYIAFNGVTALDFMGMGVEVGQQGYHLIYLGLTLVLVITAVWGRHRDLQK